VQSPNPPEAVSGLDAIFSNILFSCRSQGGPRFSHGLKVNNRLVQDCSKNRCMYSSTEPVGIRKNLPWPYNYPVATVLSLGSGGGGGGGEAF
jgi:hypothetical protein